MLTLIKINVTETQNGKTIKVNAQREDKKLIDLVTFFKPYYEKGLRVKALNYTAATGVLNAKLIAKT